MQNQTTYTVAPALTGGWVVSSPQEFDDPKLLAVGDHPLEAMGKAVGNPLPPSKKMTTEEVAERLVFVCDATFNTTRMRRLVADLCSAKLADVDTALAAALETWKEQHLP